MRTRLALLGIAAVVVAFGLTSTSGLAQSGSKQTGEEAAEPEADPIFSVLENTPGCLGVRKFGTTGEAMTYFVWFEDKAAVLAWFNGPMHTSVFDMSSNALSTSGIHKPLRHVQDTDAPILVVATMTFKDKAKFKPGDFPFTQFGMELYKPLAGGVSFGGRFAPDAVPVPKIVKYTRKEE